MSKRITAKAYSPAGSLLATWDGCEVVGSGMSLDGGLGECVIRLARQFGEEGQDFAEGNGVDLVVTDAETLAATSPEPGASELLYRGTITRVVRETGGRNGDVTISLIGNQSLLALDVLRNGAQTTLYSHATTGLTVTSGSSAAADVGLMARAVIDRHIAENPTTGIHYMTGDIPDAGVTAKYLFEAVTVRDALNALAGLVAGFHWFVDATGRVKFGAVPTTPTHSLTFGREITGKVRIERDIERVANCFLVWDGASGGTYKKFEDAASVAKYKRRMKVITDSSLKDAAAVNALGARLLAQYKDPQVKLTLPVDDSNGNANGYNIESLKPGDTVRLMGFDQDVADWVFYDAMPITQVEWTPHAATITVDASPVGIVAAQRKLEDGLAGLESRGIPVSYT